MQEICPKNLGHIWGRNFGVKKVCSAINMQPLHFYAISCQNIKENVSSICKIYEKCAMMKDICKNAKYAPPTFLMADSW